MPAKWWRFGQDGGKPPAGWEERVKADVEAAGQREAESRRAVDEAIESAGLGSAARAGDGPVVPVTGVTVEIARLGSGRTHAELEAALRSAILATVPPRREMLPCSLTPAEAPGEDAPEATALPGIPKPAPLPDGVLGYNVATRRTLSGGGWLTSADIMTREAAEHVLSVTGGTLVEVRAVTP